MLVHPGTDCRISLDRTGEPQDLIHSSYAWKWGHKALLSKAHRFLHERCDPCLFGGGQLCQREGHRPHGAFVELRIVLEAERGVPRLEFGRALEEADDLALLGVRGHPVPESRREGWRVGFDDRMEPLAYSAIRSRHRGDV